MGGSVGEDGKHYISTNHKHVLINTYLWGGVRRVEGECEGKIVSDKCVNVYLTQLGFYINILYIL